MMRVIITNGSVVSGDGMSFLEKTSVIIENGAILALQPVRDTATYATNARIIDAKGGLIIPGLISIHTHGVSFGPFFPYAWKEIPKERILFNLNAHLREGMTTVLSGDGFALPHEIEAINKIHPINIKMSTLHTPKNLWLAEVTAGYGLGDRHRVFTADEAVASGAAAIGEVGGVGIGSEIVENGTKIRRHIFTQLRLALDNADSEDDQAEIRKILIVAGLRNMTIQEARRVLEVVSLMPVEACCDAITETVPYVRKLGIPMLVHTAEETIATILHAAKELGPGLIACHINHAFTVEETIKVAKKLRRAGSIVEIVCADSFGVNQAASVPEVTFALLSEGLVDVISTDFIGGYHDPVLLILQKALEEKVITLPQAIHLATAAPARAVPRVAPNRGLIESGRIADICVVERDDISKVRYVLISGKIVVEEGRVVTNSVRH
jgi:imidazolonepropionase-like amidohydrolase